MGPRQTLGPVSPRPLGGGSGARPTSELLGSATMFQTPESEAIDQWFENLQNYEETLEDMAAASLDVNFKEELGAIEQCPFTHSLLSSFLLTLSQGSKCFPKPSEPLLSTAFCSSLPKFKSDFLLPFYSRWPDRIQ